MLGLEEDFYEDPQLGCKKESLAVADCYFLYVWIRPPNGLYFWLQLSLLGGEGIKPQTSRVSTNIDRSLNKQSSLPFKIRTGKRGTIEELTQWEWCKTRPKVRDFYQYPCKKQQVSMPWKASGPQRPMWILPPGSEFTRVIHYQLIKVQESGLFDLIEKKWFERERQKGEPEITATLVHLGYENLVFPALVMASGFFAALISGLVEKTLIAFKA